MLHRERAPALPAARSRSAGRSISASVRGRRRAASSHRLASNTCGGSKVSRAIETSTSSRPPPPKTRSTRASACPSSRRKFETATTRSGRRVTGTLPRLVSRADIRGDLHMHSSWSDGRDTIEAMVSACRDARLRVHRHHRSLAAIGGVAQPHDRRRQRGRPRRSPASASGTRTSPSCTAARWTSCRTAGSISPTASSSSSTSCWRRSTTTPGQAPEALERRYLAAMKHPLVADHHASDEPADPAPARLRPRLRPRSSRPRSRPARSSKSTARRRTSISTARSRAAPSPPAPPLVIDSDCHRADALGRQMELGVTTARRGWVEAQHVLNSRPLSEVRALLARKRGQ